MALSVVQEPPAPSLPSPLAIPATENEFKATSLTARKAHLRDAGEIHQLIKSLTHDGTLLPRSRAEIRANIHTFTIVEDDSGQFIGCAALHVYGRHLAEVRSIVVRPGNKRHGAGSILVQALLDQAKVFGIKCVCLFTRIPGFFEHFNFRVVDHHAFPDKVAKDCIRCARRNACDEIAMAVGELPAPQDQTKGMPQDLPQDRRSGHFFRPSGLVQLQLKPSGQV